jgi:3-deoxy-D-manno-octulosonate 8-phosphate phosphatase (KDO 8-P phosphatase)
VTASGRSRLAIRAGRVRLLILDVDGVLTDGRLVYGPTGEEWKVFHVHDGHAIVVALTAGLAVSVVSGRSSPAVARRMADLGVTDVHQGVSDKLALLAALCERHGVDAGATAFMGDDLPDLPLLRAVGLALAPADAVPDVRRVAHWISRRGGGAGAVREAIEWLLGARRRQHAAGQSAGTSAVPRFAS